MKCLPDVAWYIPYCGVGSSRQSPVRFWTRRSYVPWERVADPLSNPDSGIFLLGSSTQTTPRASVACIVDILVWPGLDESQTGSMVHYFSCSCLERFSLLLGCVARALLGSSRNLACSWSTVRFP